jgi:hypothetical protein
VIARLRAIAAAATLAACGGETPEAAPSGAVPVPAPTSPVPAPVPAAPTPTPTAPTPAPTGLVSGPASPATVARARAIQTDLECLRGRPFTGTPGIELQSLADFSAYLDRQIERELGGEKGDRDQRLLHALGLVEQDVDLRSMIHRSALEQAAAYYDPDTDTFYIVQEMPELVLDMVMAHELQHAQQDQHTQLLARYLSGGFESLDAELAARFLVEGEATLVGTAWMIMDVGRSALGGLMAHEVCHLPDRPSPTPPELFWPPIGDVLAAQAAQTRQQVQDPGLLGKLATRALSESMYDSMAKLRELPDFFFYSLLLPYNVGALTVYEPMRAAGWSWAGVDNLFEVPPETTEQALHPEKLVGRREPFTRPTLPDFARSAFADAVEWTADPDNRVGELGIRIWLIAHGRSEADAGTAAAGWRGDTARVWRKRDLLAFDWRMEWDTLADADELRVAIPGLLRARRPETVFETATAAAEDPATPSGQLDFTWSDPSGRTRHGRLEWDGREVYLVDGFDWPLAG